MEGNGLSLRHAGGIVCLIYKNSSTIASSAIPGTLRPPAIRAVRGLMGKAIPVQMEIRFSIVQYLDNFIAEYAFYREGEL